MANYEYMCFEHALTDKVKAIYESSFPPEERRRFCNLIAILRDDSRFRILLAIESGKLLGFLSSWTFGETVYIEHFAVDATCRNGGIGSRLLQHFIATNSDKSFILEAEHPTGEMERRRIGFYHRHGFVSRTEYTYIQPPYEPTKPSVPLLLMTHGEIPNLDAIVGKIKKAVYNI